MKRLSTSVRYAALLALCTVSASVFAVDVAAPARDTNEKVQVANKPYTDSILHKFYLSKANYKKYQKRLASLITANIEYRDMILVSVKHSVLKKVPKDILPKLKNNDEMNLIKIRNFIVDTTKQQEKFSDKLSAPTIAKDKGQLRLIQFSGPPKREWVKALAKRLKVITYINNNAYLVWGTGTDIDLSLKEQALGKRVQWISPYHPLYKIDPKIDLTSTDKVRIDVLFYDSEKFPSVINKDSMSKMTGRIFSRDKRRNNRSRIRLEIPANKIIELAKRPEIINISRYFSPQLGGERQAQIVAGNTTPLAPIVACSDDTGSCASAGAACSDGSGTCISLTPTAPSGPGYLNWLTTKGFTVDQFLPEFDATTINPDFFVVDFGDSGFDNGAKTDTDNIHDAFEDENGNSRVHYVQYAPSLDMTEGLGADTINPNDDNTDFFMHGTLVASIIAGHYKDTNVGTQNPLHEDASEFAYGMGIAPFVHIGSTKIFNVANHLTPPSDAFKLYVDATSLQAWFESSYNKNARISSNSWSNKVGASDEYDPFSHQIDSLTRDANSDSTDGNQEMVTVFLSGNTQDTLWNNGATAKNAIVVGGSENVDPVAGGCVKAASNHHAANAMDIVINSSQGPTEDGRIKPDLVAPGTRISGARTGRPKTFYEITCTNDSGYAVDGVVSDIDNSSVPTYIRRVGTSFAAPAVAGGAALLRQWFVNKRKNDPEVSDDQEALENSLLAAPSPAMTKAWLMNTTTYMTGIRANDDLPSPRQGMGRLNLKRALNTVPRLIRDQVTVLNQGDGDYILQGQTGANIKPFRVTLAWTDAAAPAMNQTNQLKNNLNLEVVIGANTYLGNNFAKDISQTGDLSTCPETGIPELSNRDCRNNVESVWLPSLPANTPFTIRVKPTAITMDGVPTIGGITDQDFALVIYNATFQTPLSNSLGTVTEDSTDNNLTTLALQNTPLDSTALRVIPPVSTTAGSVSAIGGELFYDATGVDNLGPDGPNGSATITYTVTDGYGATVTATADVTIIGTDDPPSGMPSISGTQTEDEDLTANTSGISDADGLTTPNFTYQWKRGTTNVGTDSNTYTLGDADVGAMISVTVGFTDDGGTTASITSGPTGPISNMNDDPTGFTISGMAKEDETLTAEGLTDDDGLSTATAAANGFTYQWKRTVGTTTTNIGTNSNTYTLGDADVGAMISVTVSYTDDQGTAETATATAVGPIENVNDDPANFAISGMTKEDETLTAEGLTDDDGLSTATAAANGFTYQWKRTVGTTTTNIGTNSNTYTLGDADVGAMISVTVSYTDDQGTAETATATAVGPIENVNDDPANFAISGMTKEDETLTAEGLTDDDGLSTATAAANGFTYQWKRTVGTTTTNIGTNSNTYTLGDADVGAMISVTVSYTDDQGTAETATATAVGPIENVNDDPANFAISGMTKEDETLTAEGLTDDDGLSTATAAANGFTYQWKRTVGTTTTNIGTNSNTYTLGDADVGAMISVTVSYTDDQGTAETATATAVGPIENVNDPPTIDLDSASTISHGLGSSASEVDFSATFDQPSTAVAPSFTLASIVGDIDIFDAEMDNLTIEVKIENLLDVPPLTADEPATLKGEYLTVDINDGTPFGSLSGIISNIGYSYAISGSPGSEVGTLTLSPAGTPTLNNYKTVLEKIRYVNTKVPAKVANRKVKFTVSDGGGTDAIAYSLISINVPRKPVDIVLVLDTSGSMSSTPTGAPAPKIDMLQNAVKMFIDTWANYDTGNDQIGVSYFNTNIELFPSTLAATMLDFDGTGQITPGELNRDTLKGDVEGKIADNCTGLGTGLQNAIAALNAQPATHEKFIILFSDGLQNLNPKVLPISDTDTSLVIKDGPTTSGSFAPLPGLPFQGGQFVGVTLTGGCGSVTVPPGISDPVTKIEDLPITIHTIGIGETESDPNQGLMATIASQSTGADAHFTDDPGVFDDLFLQTLVASLSQTSLEMVAHLSGTFSDGDSAKSETFTLNNASHKASFIISWKGKTGKNTLNFILKGPDGNSIPFGAEGINVIDGDTYKIMHLTFPIKTPLGNITSGGNWQMVTNENLSANETLDYDIWVLEDDFSVKDNIRLDKPFYETGKPILVTTKITDIGLPVRDLKVTARTSRPKIGVGSFLSKNNFTASVTKKIAQTKLLSDQFITPVDYKLHVLLKDPALRAQLKPITETITLNDDGLHGDKLANDGIYSGLYTQTRRPGQYIFDININGKLPINGRISRTKRLSTLVKVRKIIPTLSDIKIKRISDKLGNVILTLTPTDMHKNNLGPGRADAITINTKEATPVGPLVDNLDGSYTQLLRVDSLLGDEIKFKVLDSKVIVDIPIDPRIYWFIIFILFLLVCYGLYKLLKKQP